MMQNYLDSVVPPVLHSLVDPDARVRYYACEALYNIAKVAREDFMPHFLDTFEALFRLCADADQAVHQATSFLDNLLKVRGTVLACSHVGKRLEHLHSRRLSVHVTQAVPEHVTVASTKLHAST